MTTTIIGLKKDKVYPCLCMKHFLIYLQSRSILRISIWIDKSNYQPIPDSAIFLTFDSQRVNLDFTFRQFADFFMRPSLNCQSYGTTSMIIFSIVTFFFIREMSKDTTNLSEHALLWEKVCLIFHLTSVPCMILWQALWGGDYNLFLFPCRLDLSVE